MTTKRTSAAVARDQQRSGGFVTMGVLLLAVVLFAMLNVVLRANHLLHDRNREMAAELQVRADLLVPAATSSGRQPE